MGIVFGWLLTPPASADFSHIPASEFVSGDAGVLYRSGSCVFMNSTYGFMVAPVDLPDGAIIKNIRVFYYDNSSESIELEFIRHNQFSGDRNILFSIVTQGQFNGSRSSVDSICSPAPSYRKVYNNTCQYYLKAQFGTEGGTLAIFGVSIEYI